jgi:hypothetical protein
LRVSADGTKLLLLLLLLLLLRSWRGPDRIRSLLQLVLLMLGILLLLLLLLLLSFSFQLLLLLLFGEFQQFGLELVHVLSHFGRLLFGLFLASRQLVRRQLLIGRPLVVDIIAGGCRRR